MILPSDRRSHNILVPAASSTGSIAVIRSLGAAGYRVHAIAPDPKALGLQSRFATASIVNPPIASPHFAEWFREYIYRNSIEMIVPGGGFNPSGKDVFREHAELFPLSRNANVLHSGRSKADLFARLIKGNSNQRANLPPFLLVNLDQEVPDEAELATLGAPLFIKVDESYARQPNGDAVIKVADAATAKRKLASLSHEYRTAIIQGFVPGRGVGAYLLRWNNRTLARMMHMRLHEMPHTGGASSLRRTWWHEAIMGDAEAKLDCIGWEGVAMVEYRWDRATDKFYLMEMNLRFWGSLHLSLLSGVDFPRLLADAFLFGELPENTIEACQHATCRNTIPYEIGYLLSLWRDKNVPLIRKIYAALEAIALSCDPRVHNDLMFAGDRRLFFIRIKDLLLGNL